MSSMLVLPMKEILREYRSVRLLRVRRRGQEAELMLTPAEAAKLNQDERVYMLLGVIEEGT